MSRYYEQMQKLVEEYRDAGNPWPAKSRDMASWLIRNNKWNRGESTIIDLCARDISRAMREEYHTDPQGRRVRTKHAAKFPAPGTEEGQMTLWHDIRNAPRKFMECSFANRRNQIVGDCVQLNTDVKSYNENVSKDDPIPMLFDMTDDVAESEQTGVFKSAKAGIVADEVFGAEDRPFEMPALEGVEDVKPLEAKLPFIPPTASSPSDFPTH